MAQIQTGTAAINTDFENPQAVWASPGNDWSQVTKTNALFGVSDVWFEIQAPAYIDTGHDNQWRLDLTVPCNLPANETATYAIQTDFEPYFGFPLFAAGDTQTTSLLNRVFTRLGAALSQVGIQNDADISVDADFTWGGTSVVLQNVALTADRNGTLPPAANYPSGYILTYVDFKTPDTAAFGRIWSPISGDTLQGGVTPIKAFSGEGTAYFISDGSNGWILLGRHAQILQLQDSTNPSREVIFNLAGITPGTTRVITVPDQDITLAAGGAHEDFDVQTSDQAAPASGKLRLFARAVSGNPVFRTVNDDGIAKSLQFALWNRTQVIWSPHTAANGLALGSNVASSGTATDGAFGSGSLYKQGRRKVYSSVVTTVGQQIGLVADDAMFSRNTGLFFFCRFALVNWTSGNRIFIGLTNAAASAIVAANPSTMLNFFAFAQNTPDSAMALWHNGNGTATSTAISGVPGLVPDRAFDAYFFCNAADSTLYYRLDDYNSGANIVDTSIAFDSTFPVASAFLRMACMMSNGANTSVNAAQIAILKMYCESK